MKRTFLYNGDKVSLTFPNGTGNVGRVIKKGRFYEQKFLRYIASANLGGTYLDVGANIGNHTVYFGKFTSADKVIGFEPNPKAFKILEKNVSANNLESKVKIFNVAIGETNGKCSIRTNPADEIGGASVVEGNDVNQWILDKYINENITVIKIDVEGFEENVLKGAAKLLNRHKPDLFIEITSRNHFENIFYILSEYGYRPVTVFNNSATFHFSVNKVTSKSYNIYKFYPFRRLIRYS